MTLAKDSLVSVDYMRGYQDAQALAHELSPDLQALGDALAAAAERDHERYGHDTWLAQGEACEEASCAAARAWREARHG